MKHPMTLSRIKTGLLIIDMQEKFAPVIPDFDDIVANVMRLTLTFQMYKMPILVSEQYPQGLGRTVDIIKKQFPVIDIIEKNTFSCTAVPEFWTHVYNSKLETLVVCGIESHVCVNQTVLGLLQQEMKVHVVSDAIGSRNREDHDIAVRKMEMAGAAPASTEMVLFELTEQAGTESFRIVQKMVKSDMRKSAEMKQSDSEELPENVSPPESDSEEQAPESREQRTVETAEEEMRNDTETGEGEQTAEQPQMDVSGKTEEDEAGGAPGDDTEPGGEMEDTGEHDETVVMETEEETVQTAEHDDVAVEEKEMEEEVKERDDEQSAEAPEEENEEVMGTVEDIEDVVGDGILGETAGEEEGEVESPAEEGDGDDESAVEIVSDDDIGSDEPEQTEEKEPESTLTDEELDIVESIPGEGEEDEGEKSSGASTDSFDIAELESMLHEDSEDEDTEKKK
jgi:nicotinamidase-related amidase